MMTLLEYEGFDGLGLAELVKQGDVSPAELLEAAIRLTTERNPHLNAIVIEAFDQARSVVTRQLPSGPFTGTPFLLKDLFTSMKGLRMTNGCLMFRDNVPDHDSELAARYKAAGLVIFGRTASPEFGLTTTTESAIFGQTKNPWSPEHTSGGSSGGAASAVASGIVPIAHASDGGGSIRIPASCCGLFGLKPTRARVPMGPDVGEGWSGMSTHHAVTRSVRDSAALLDAVAGAGLGAPYFPPPAERPFLAEVGRPPMTLRIAFTTEAFNGVKTDPECVRATEAAASLCRELGHEVVEGSPSLDNERLAAATPVIAGANVLATLQDRAAQLGRDLQSSDVEPGTWELAKGLFGRGPEDYARAIRVLHATGRALAFFFEGYDLLLSPTMAAPPHKLGELSLSHPNHEEFVANLRRTIAFTQLMNVAGNPAMSVPLHWSDDGLPIGVQFAARFGDEATLFRLAAQLEEARPWFNHRPAE